VKACRSSALAASSALVLAAFASSASAEPARPVGPNTITGHLAASAGANACGAGTVYLYVSFPDFSGADGGARNPPFEVPGPDVQHWQAPCTAGAFTFTQIPDGTYMPGLPPKAGAGRTMAEVVTVEGGKSVEIELKPEGAER
jgi:hypothetical protein